METIKLLEEKLKEYIKRRDYVLSHYEDNWYENVKLCDGAIEALEFAIDVVRKNLKDI